MNNWETGRLNPQLRHQPAVSAFLGRARTDATPVTLGDRVRVARRIAGLSQRALAELLGLDDGTIRDLERGTTHRPVGRVRAALNTFLAENGRATTSDTYSAPGADSALGGLPTEP